MFNNPITTLAYVTLGIASIIMSLLTIVLFGADVSTVAQLVESLKSPCVVYLSKTFYLLLSSG